VVEVELRQAADAVRAEELDRVEHALEDPHQFVGVDDRDAPP
jgi:hypothetical protein